MDDLAYFRPLLVQLAVVSVKARFAAELESTFFKMAAAIHPKFKLHWVDDNAREWMISMVRAELRTHEAEPRAANTSSLSTGVSLSSIIKRCMGRNDQLYPTV